MAIAKAAVAGVGVVGLATATTIAMVSSSGMPEWRPLSEDATGTYTSNYAASFTRFLVGVSDNAKSDSKYKNIDLKAWWEWSFNSRYSIKKPTEGGFKDLKDAAALKKACEAAYGGTAGTETPIEVTVTATKYKEEEIWKYCSPIEVKIESIKDVTSETYSTSGTYGATGNDTKFVSVKSQKAGNVWFWNEKEKEFANHTFSPENTNSAFQKLKKKPNRNPSTDTVKKICETAYGKTVATNDTTDEYPKAEVYKFCSLKGAE